MEGILVKSSNVSEVFFKFGVVEFVSLTFVAFPCDVDEIVVAAAAITSLFKGGCPVESLIDDNVGAVCFVPVDYFIICVECVQVWDAFLVAVFEVKAFFGGYPSVFESIIVRGHYHTDSLVATFNH